VPGDYRYARRNSCERSGESVLEVFATGGIYLAGGNARRLVGPLQDPRFIQTFSRKGRFTQLMERVPVDAVTTRPALIGAAANGLENLKQPLGPTSI
jgi:glucokinase